MKRQAALPSALALSLIGRGAAAAYVCVSPNAFDRMVDNNWESMSVHALWLRFNGERATPQSTVEAIMYCVRERGQDNDE